MWLNENRGTDPMKAILIALAFLGVAGCIVIGDARRPIAFETIAAPQARRPSARVIIVLPGFGSRYAREMKERGVASAIQEAWPEVDVILARRDLRLLPRGQPGRAAARRGSGASRCARATAQVWLTGASLGGMGALLYEQQHPGAVAGIVLFAPFLGDRSLLAGDRQGRRAARLEPGRRCRSRSIPRTTSARCGR